MVVRRCCVGLMGTGGPAFDLLFGTAGKALPSCKIGFGPGIGGSDRLAFELDPTFRSSGFFGIKGSGFAGLGALAGC